MSREFEVYLEAAIEQARHLSPTSDQIDAYSKRDPFDAYHIGFTDCHEAVKEALAALAAQPEAQAGGDLVCSICEEVVEKIEAGYVPRGHGVYSKPFTTPPAKVPDGWKLVPVEPTYEMEIVAAPVVAGRYARRALYQAMLAAAPAPKEGV